MKRGLNIRPEYSALVFAAFAWGVMFWEAWERKQWSCCHPRATLVDEARGWILMIFAMMLPFTYPVLKVLVERSYRRRRVQTVVGYVKGYVAIWLLPLAIVLPLRSTSLGHEMILASLLCLFAALWTLHPAREKFHRSCHREISIRPEGWAANYDACRQGVLHAIPCFGSCLFLMIACTVTHHHFVIMIGGTLLVAFENKMLFFRHRALAAGEAALGIWTLFLI